jgi:hypothetical protein
MQQPIGLDSNVCSGFVEDGNAQALKFLNDANARAFANEDCEFVNPTCYSFRTQYQQDPQKPAACIPEAIILNSHVHPSDITTHDDFTEIKTSITPLKERVYWDEKPWNPMEFESDASSSYTSYTTYTTYTTPYTPHFTHQQSPIQQSIYPKLETERGEPPMVFRTDTENFAIDVDRLRRIVSRVTDLDADDTNVDLAPPVDDMLSLLENTVITSAHEREKRPRRRKRAKQEPVVEESPISVVEALQSNEAVWNVIKEIKKKGIYKCGHCDAIFSSMLQLGEHIDEYKIKRRYKCPFSDCPWSILGLPRRAEVRRHCAAQHACIIDTETLENMSPNSPSQLPTGELLQFTEAEKFQCSSPLCKKWFKRRDACLRHKKLVHQNPESRFNKRVDGLRDKFNTDDVEELTRLLAITQPKRS